MLTITLNRPEVLNALDRATNDGLARRARGGGATRPSARSCSPEPGAGSAPAQDLGELARRRARPRRPAPRAAQPQRARDPRAREAGPRRGQRAGRRRRALARARVRRADRRRTPPTFVPAFVGVGLAPDAGATWHARRAARRRPRVRVADHRQIAHAPTEAQAWGLVSEVVPADELAARAAEVAELFAAMPTRAVWETKRLLDAAETATLAEQLELEAWRAGRAREDARLHRGRRRVPREARGRRSPVRRPSGSIPVQLVVRDDLRRWRLTVLFRLLLALPHLVVATAVAVPRASRRGRRTGSSRCPRPGPPHGLHDWTARCVRYWTQVQAYTWLIADPYPGFRGWPGTYPVDLDVAPPAPQARWTTLFRLILAIPAYVLMVVFGVVLQVVARDRVVRRASRSAACREECAT